MNDRMGTYVTTVVGGRLCINDGVGWHPISAAWLAQHGCLFRKR
jgi:hypothetical protein